MLFRNVLRTLKKRYLQLLLLGVIIVLSSFIYTTMDYAIMGTMAPTEEYFDEANQEDFAIQMLDVLLEDDVTYILSNCPVFATLSPDQWPFTVSGVKVLDEDCYYGLLDRRVDTITSTYNHIDLEVRESKDLYFSTNNTSYRFRVLKETTRINQSYFVDGRAPQVDNEIAVAEIFAKKNDLTIGDPFNINDTTYTITGYVLFPDYSLTLLDSGIIIDNQTQTLALMTDGAFEALDEVVHFEIAGVYTDGYTEKEFDKEVIQDYRDQDQLTFVSNMVLTINNMRSGAIYSELEGGRGMSIFLSLLIASIALMIVAIMVSRVLHSQRGPLGLLKSMGYTNGQIARPYLFFIAILSLPMVLLGYFVGLKMAYPFMNIYLDFYLLPSQPIQQSLATIIIAIIVPFFFIVGLSYIIILRLLRQKPVVLLNPEVTSDTNKLTKWIAKYFKKFKITTKLQQLLLYRNLVKFTVFVIGMFYAAFLILFTFSMNGIFDRMIYDYYENTNHNYIGYCDYVGDCDIPSDGEAVIELPSIIINEEDASMVALSPSSTIHPIYDKKGQDITAQLQDKDVIITHSIALTRGYKVGDVLDILVGDETHEFTVVAISEEYTGNKIYANKDIVSDYLTGNNDYYNAVYSISELSRDDYLVVISIDDIINQADSMSSFMNAFVLIMVVVSISIGAIIIYILTVMTIEDNFYNISLFKVIGYNNKEIDRMILGGYLFYGIGTFILSVPIAIVSFVVMEMFFAQFYDLLFPIHFAWWHAIVAIVIYIIIFYIGAASAKRKLSQISLQEAMKMYQV